MADASAQPRLRPWVPIVGLLAGLGLVAGLVGGPLLLQWAASNMTMPSMGETETPAPAAKLSKEYDKAVGTYGPVAPPAAVAPPAGSLPTQAVLQGRTATPESPVSQQSMLDSLNPFGARGGTPGGQQPSQAPTPPQTPTAATPTQATQAVPAKPPKKGWGFAVEVKVAPSPPPEVEGLKADLGKETGATALIHPATWAKPAYPLVTIYRSQTLIGRLAQNVNSDIPGQVKIELSLPLYDKFGYDHLILDKGTLIIATQDGKPQYGAMRLPLKLEQLELLTGEVVTFKAMVGDQEGANGVAGKVNNHYGKLLLATGLSAVLNIGVQTATGTPSGFYQSPAQKAAQDLGQDVQSSAKEVIGRELKVAPTIEIKAGTNVTINLQENITFSRRPVVIK